MNTVPAGSAKPFEVAFGVTGLFVAMTVKDVSVPSSPIVVATVPMVHVGDGQYVGLFTPDAKSYAVLKQAYTDGTYTTPNPDYYPGSESFEAVLPRAIGSGDIVALGNSVWDAALSEHTTPGSFGWALDGRVSILEKEGDADLRYQTLYAYVQTIEAQQMIIDAKQSTLLGRITSPRAAALDLLDVAVSSREAETAADARAIAAHADAAALALAINGVLVAVETSDPAAVAALALLEHAVYGLAALATAIDTRATGPDMLTALAALTGLAGALDDSGTGLAAIKAAVDVAVASLADPGSGLDALAAAFAPLATSAALAALPTAAQNAAAVWGKATADAVAAGSYGERLTSKLDAQVSTRAPGTATDSISAAVAALNALLTGGNGLVQIRSDVAAVGVAVADVDSDVANVDSDLATAKALILAAIAALSDGTPDVLAELAIIKGAFVAGDDLHSIRAAIGTGSATLAKQDTILAVLDAIKGGGWSTQTLVAIAAGETTTQSQLAAARLSIETKTDAAKASADSGVAIGLGTTSRLDHASWGLAAAKDQRDALAAAAAANQAALLAATAAVSAKLDGMIAQAAADLATIMAGFGAFDLTALETTTTATLAIVQDSVLGVAALHAAIASLSSAESGHAAATAAALADLEDGLTSLAASMSDIQGGGFDSTASLRAIADALAALAATVAGTATSTQADQAILLLHELADGNSGHFDAATDSLHALGAAGQFLEGVTTGV